MDEGANAHTPGPYLDDGEHRRVQSGAAHRPQSLATLQPLDVLSHRMPSGPVRAVGETRMHVRFGARHLERINSERQDASAPQTYGYISELFSSLRHVRVDPGVRCAQLITILVHYLALHDDGQLPPARSSAAAWARLPPPPYCDADGRPRTLPEVHVEQAASSCVGTPVASRRHAGVTPAVKLVPAVHEPMERTHGTSVPRRQFYDEAGAGPTPLWGKRGGVVLYTKPLVYSCTRGS